MVQSKPKRNESALIRLLEMLIFIVRQFSETKDKNIKNIQNLKYLPAVKEIIETSRNVVEEVPNHERRDRSC